MKNILEELYFGNICPNERDFSHNEQYSKAIQTIASNEEKLNELLEGKEKKLFLDLMDAVGEFNGASSVEYFITGFRLGAQLQLAMMGHETSCLFDVDFA